MGYPLPALRQAGLVTAAGYDTYAHRIVFPLEGNLYGRSISASAPPHRFLPGAKGGLYAWEQVRRYPEVILVEGLFDYAVLWQAGFHNVTCSLGNHLNARQFRQLCDGTRTVYLAFRCRRNGSGQQAAQRLACRLSEQGVNARRVQLTRWARSEQLLRPRRRCPAVPMPAGGGARMTFQVIHAPDADNARSPFRIVEQPMGREVEWVNRFLDREYVRRLAETTLRSYAMDLLHFLRWWASVNHTDAINEGALSATVLLDYLRFQAGHAPPARGRHHQPPRGRRGARVAQRVSRYGQPLRARFHHFYWRRSPLGYGRPRPALSRLRVKEPKRIVMPLSVDEVARFWSSFRTSRDLAIVGLMLLQGLRSKEVIALNCEDLLLSESQMRVRGKGNKIRFLPLASDTVQLLDHYLRLERPDPCGPALFVSLKGPARGSRMTPAGLRSLFRSSPPHHRKPLPPIPTAFDTMPSSGLCRVNSSRP